MIQGGMKNRRIHFCALWLLVGCSAGETQDSSSDVEPESTEGLAALHSALQEDAQALDYEEGQWTEDFGDAAAFGPTYYAHAFAL